MKLKTNRFVTKFVKGLDNQNKIIVADPLHCPTEVSYSLLRCKNQAD